MILSYIFSKEPFSEEIFLAKRDIIVIGASAGGVQTLQDLMSRLPANLPASIFIVLHTTPYGETQLPEILNRVGHLPAVQARNLEKFEPGHIYIAPPDRHLLLSQRGMTLVETGPRENFNRPAIDPLFRSAARAYGTRVIGIVLSGLLDDGSGGLAEIQRAGGITVVQDPEEALHRQMPESAAKLVAVDYILPIAKMAPLLKKIVTQDAPEPVVTMGGEKEEHNHNGSPSVYSCPDCGGVLWELEEGNLIRFRCRVGHAYSEDSLNVRQSEDVERALWTALTSLEESVSFSRRLAGRAWQRGDRYTALHYEQKVNTAERDAQAIRALLMVDTPAQPLNESEFEEEPPA